MSLFIVNFKEFAMYLYPDAENINFWILCV